MVAFRVYTATAALSLARRTYGISVGAMMFVFGPPMRGLHGDWRWRARVASGAR